MVVTRWLAVRIVTNRDKRKAGGREETCNNEQIIVSVTAILSKGWCTQTSVGQWEQPVDHNRGTLIGQYILAENHRTGKQLEQLQLQQGCSRKHWLHIPGSTGCSYERWTGWQESQLQKHECLQV